MRESSWSKTEKKILDSSREAQMASLKQIFDFFQSGDQPATRDAGMSEAYRALAILCDRKGMSIVNYQTLVSVYGERHTVTDIAEISHFPIRKIALEKDWHLKDCGDFLAFFQDGKDRCVPVVLFRQSRGYVWCEPNGTLHHPDEDFLQSLGDSGYVVYRPFPSESLNLSRLIRYAGGCVRKRDLILCVLMGLLVTAVGLILPELTRMIYDLYINLDKVESIIGLCSVLFVCNLSALCFSAVRNLGFFRICSRIKYEVQAAVYDRVLNMPAASLREMKTGDLANRVAGVGELVESIFTILGGSLFSAILSLGYMIVMFSYDERLSWRGLLLLVLAVLCMLPFFFLQLKDSRRALAAQSAMASTAYLMIRGVESVKISGAENKAAQRYLTGYIDERKALTSATRQEQRIALIQVFFTTLMTLVFFLSAGNSSDVITTGVYLGFTSAFGCISSAVFMLMTSLTKASRIRPLLDRALPLLQTRPDYDGHGIIPESIEGNLSVDHLHFSYHKDSPEVIHDVTFAIHSGEYIGIVGPSGCGKSTLLKLLLGMEVPTVGRIYYDTFDLQQIDHHQLRRQIGVMLQNERLFSGSIYDNITLSCPGATSEEVLQAIDAVGLREDISRMPMGIHTVISEGGGNFSGGQKQRIMIARAILARPSMLFMDEATSALDNVIQKAVCDSLEALRITRIVIAQRLSTIRNCDRILVMDKGQIVEEGNYDELMALKGLFYRMSIRQTVQYE